MINTLGPNSGKMAIVQQSFESGKFLSMVALLYGVATRQLFLWRTQNQEDSYRPISR